jgi:hypothetical protein
MKKLTRIEEEALRKLSNKTFDIFYFDVEFSEKRADETAQAVVEAARKKLEAGE